MSHPKENEEHEKEEEQSSSEEESFFAYQPGRVTLDLSGPELALPEEGEVAVREPRFSLELDTGELRALTQDPAKKAPLFEMREAPGEETPSPLDLDLSGYDPGTAEPEGEEVHDAWTMDRLARRSTTPPPGGKLRSSRPPGQRTSRPSNPAVASVQPHPYWLEPDTGDAIHLVDQARPSYASQDLATEMVEKYALDDYTGALRAAELLLGKNPEHEEAKNYASSCRERLEQIYSSRLGALDKIVVIAVADTELRWLGLDHRAGFLMSRIDGQHTVEEILDISGMTRLETLKTLVDLVDAGTVWLT